MPGGVNANGPVLQQLISSFVFAKLDWPMVVSFKELVHNEKQIRGVQTILSDLQCRKSRAMCREMCEKRKILRGADSADILAVKTEEPVSDWN